MDRTHCDVTPFMMISGMIWADGGAYAYAGVVVAVEVAAWCGHVTAEPIVLKHLTLSGCAGSVLGGI